ncbi:MAG TPA: amidohydrolase family protein [Leptospiraceae bacterium]|nr:amidohydrolase family protein [Leptospiraceae bacterium]HMW61804.1 amidohydrolase family protein [Leptospiraceae bacterium]HNL02660.1 amidohydrolase family protein [Leptospiraceae bacterium]HNL70468.1 amidohydrolase family protein [Leptospiraceae bacterium]HNN75390.1 amidohydrolase family protein [Leptospiraceae bacterium]
MHFHQVMENDLHSATQTEDAARSLKTESTMDVSDYIECIERNADEWRKTCQSANFMFFNHSLFEGTTLSSVVQRIQAQFPGSACTALMNVEKPARLEVLRNLKSIGFCAIKFHPYSQKIESQHLDCILEICGHAQTLGMPIFICTSFGTAKMHDHDGIGLACKIADRISGVPIVLLHAGAIRCFEAFLLAEDRLNVFLETSFSLDYLEGSRYIDDFMFIFKRLGSERILYGSDSPFVRMDSAKEALERRLRGYGFSGAELQNIFHDNAARMFARKD